MRKLNLILLILSLSVLIFGCSTIPSNPLINNPSASPRDTDSGIGGTRLWGLFEFSIDTENGTIDVVPLRTASVEVNILKHLEAPIDTSFLAITDFNMSPPKIDFTLSLTHPFPNNPELAGFTVRGVIITDGTLDGFENPAIVMSASNELRLTNADGFTRWMNPKEFPFNGSIFNYFPGEIGDPAGDTHKSTLNPYKLFADSLNALPDDLDLDESSKASFTPGSTNSRRYELDFGSQPLYKFQYAAVASWEMPFVVPPQIPDDFPFGTVADEPWRVDVIETFNGLYYENSIYDGDLDLSVIIRDFENAGQNSVFLESPGVFPRQEMTLVSQDGTHVTFEQTVLGIILTGTNPFEILVSASATDGEGFDGRLPGEELATYVVHTVNVADTAPALFYDDFESFNHVWTPHGGEWWGKADGYMDASNGGDCYEEDTGNYEMNPNVSFVSSPPIFIHESEHDLVITIHHTIDVDPVEPSHNWAWDMCYVRINGEVILPTGGPPYEFTHIPGTMIPWLCWTGNYDWTESVFNLGTDYNGTTIEIEFVLDTFDYVANCDPPFFGWLIDDITVDFLAG